MTIKCIHRDLLDEIIEKIGSMAIIECEPSSKDDDEMFDIQIDTNIVHVHYYEDHLFLVRDYPLNRIIVIDRLRFFEVAIL